MLSQKSIMKRSGTFALAIILSLSVLIGAVGALDSVGVRIITTHEELKSAVSNAEDGDILYVGDIDFSPSSPDVYRSVMEIVIDKSITVRSGKTDGQALFSDCIFTVKGSKVSGEKITVNFENIVFDGGIDTNSLTYDNYPDSYGTAIGFSGNVDAVFRNCVFKNFTDGDGSVMNIRYGDYTANEFLSALYTDQSGCRLDLTFNSCTVKDNASLYTGGAFYIDSDNNVTLNMTDCTLSGNRSGVAYGMGGGAVYAQGVTVNMTGCDIVGNCGNCVYNGLEPYITNDTTRGGGAYFSDCRLSMKDCIVSENIGSLGGGLALTNTKADIDGCTFTHNEAVRCVYVKDQGTALPWDGMAMGGALYTEGNAGKTATLINSTVIENRAEVAHGGVYQFYTGDADASLGVNYLHLVLCTYANNICDNDGLYDFDDTEKRQWLEIPGDTWTEPNTTATACVIIDRYFNIVFPKNGKPTDENGYNYFATPMQAESDGVVINEGDEPFVTIPEGESWSLPDEVFESLIGERYDGKLTHGSVGSNYSSTLYRDEKQTDVTTNDGTTSAEDITSTDETSSTENTTTTEVEITSTDIVSADETTENGSVGDDNENANRIFLYVSIGGAVVMFGCIAALIVKGKHKNSVPTESYVQTDEAPELVEEAKREKQTINAKYTDGQIDKLMTTIPEVHLLTDREREVFLKILQGKKLGEISAELFISDSTVKNFYQKIYSKMGVTSKDALLKKIFEEAKKL